MAKVARRLIILSLAPFAAGCGDPPEPVDRTPAGRKPWCELAATTELADENEVAPNGQTGAQILAAVPESLHTSLHWKFSSSSTEVEVPGSIGPSTGLDLVFSFPSEPRFFFVDRVVVEPSGEIQLDVLVICEDYVTTTLDVAVMTEDGTVALELEGLTVRLGPDRPEDDYVAKPFVSEIAAMAALKVNFLQPEALAANSDKSISIGFDGPSTEGALIVYAEGSSATYWHLVARW